MKWIEGSNCIVRLEPIKLFEIKHLPMDGLFCVVAYDGSNEHTLKKYKTSKEAGEYLHGLYEELKYDR